MRPVDPSPSHEQNDSPRGTEPMYCATRRGIYSQRHSKRAQEESGQVNMRDDPVSTTVSKCNLHPMLMRAPIADSGSESEDIALSITAADDEPRTNSSIM